MTENQQTAQVNARVGGISDFDIRLIAAGLLRPKQESIRALALELLKWRGVKPL